MADKKTTLREQRELVDFQRKLGALIQKSEVKKILSAFLKEYKEEDVKYIGRGFLGSGHAVGTMLESFVDDVTKALDDPLRGV